MMYEDVPPSDLPSSLLFTYDASQHLFQKIVLPLSLIFYRCEETRKFKNFLLAMNFLQRGIFSKRRIERYLVYIFINP